MTNLVESRARISPSLRRIVNNTGWLFSDSIVRLLVSLVIGAWVARYLGVNSYGKLSLALTYVALVVPILKLGLDQIIVQHLAQETLEPGRTIGTTLTMRLVCIPLVIGPLIFIVSQLHHDDPMLVFLVVILGIGPFFQAFQVINNLFQARLESRYTVLAGNAGFLTSSGLKVIAILTHAHLVIFGILYLVDTIIYTGVLLWFYFRHQKINTQPSDQWHVDWNLAHRLLHESWPLIIAGIAVSIYMRIDQVMLAQLSPQGSEASAVGIYAVAVRISELWFFIPTAIISSSFPVLLQLRQSNIEQYQRRLQQLFRLVALISYMAGLAISVLSGLIIDVLYGSAYVKAAPVLAILSWSGIWVSIGLLRSQVLVAENKTLFSMLSTGCGAVINIFLNLLLIPSLGPVGCAIATFLAYGISAYVTSFMLRNSNLFKIQTLALIYPNPFHQ